MVMIPVVALDDPGWSPRWVAHCDRCGTWSTPRPSQHTARDTARDTGWRIPPGETGNDTCPDCQTFLAAMGAP